MINYENVSADRNSSPIGGCTYLIKVSRSKAWLVLTLDHTAGINAIDSTPVVDVQSQRHLARGCECKVPFALPSASPLDSAPVWIDLVFDSIAKLVKTKTGSGHQPSVPKANALLYVACFVRDMCVRSGCYAG